MFSQVLQQCLHYAKNFAEMLKPSTVSAPAAEPAKRISEFFPTAPASQVQTIPLKDFMEERRVSNPTAHIFSNESDTAERTKNVKLKDKSNFVRWGVAATLGTALGGVVAFDIATIEQTKYHMGIKAEANAFNTLRVKAAEKATQELVAIESDLATANGNRVILESILRRLEVVFGELQIVGTPPLVTAKICALLGKVYKNLSNEEDALVYLDLCNQFTLQAKEDPESQDWYLMYDELSQQRLHEQLPRISPYPTLREESDEVTDSSPHPD